MDKFERVGVELVASEYQNGPCVIQIVFLKKKTTTTKQSKLSSFHVIDGFSNHRQMQTNYYILLL